VTIVTLVTPPKSIRDQHSPAPLLSNPAGFAKFEVLLWPARCEAPFALEHRKRDDRLTPPRPETRIRAPDLLVHRLLSTLVKEEAP
jgi:hypothetical protein